MSRWASTAVAVYLHGLSSSEAAAWAAQEVADTLGFPAPAEEIRLPISTGGRSIRYMTPDEQRPYLDVIAFLPEGAPEYEPVVL